MQKAHVPAMIDQIRAGCIRCGEHATLACVLRNSQYTQFVNIRERSYPMTLWFIRWCHEMHSGMFRSNSFTSLLVVATNVLQVLKFCLRAVQPFQEGAWEFWCLCSMRDGRFRGENNVRLCSIGCFSSWWFELILSTSPFL